MLTSRRRPRRCADEPAFAITKLSVNEKPGARVVCIPSSEVLSEHFEFEDLRALTDDEAVTKGLAATFSARGARMRMPATDTSHDPAVKAAALRDLQDRRTLGRLVREAAGR